MREFETGATRDSDDTKLDPSGFLSPLVIKRYSEYMTRHRVQADGQLRSSRNWRKGIPKEAYQDSMIRHVLDAWLILDGFPLESREPLEETLCAILFNVCGLLHEEIIERKKLERGRV